MTERDLADVERADDETTESAATESTTADAQHDADVVRLVVRDAEATEVSTAAGSALVTRGTITVPRAEVEAWLRTGAVERE